MNLEIKSPNGLSEIISTFGNLQEFVNMDGHVSTDWEDIYIGMALLTFSIPLAWDTTINVKRISCHKLLIPKFEEVFSDIVTENLQHTIKSYGGCYAYRPQRGSNKYSTHCWGIAIDLNPTTNEMGTPGDMSPFLVEIFKQHGFTWGGDFINRKDPMHFQYCTEY